MGFRPVHSGKAQIDGVYTFFGRSVKGKSMARLVGEHVHIGTGTVEIRENERIFVFFHKSAISAGGFSLFGFHIKEIGIHHQLDEFCCFGRHLGIHLPASFHDFFLGALWGGISIGKTEKIIPEFKVRYTDALSLSGLDL